MDQEFHHLVEDAVITVVRQKASDLDALKLGCNCALGYRQHQKDSFFELLAQLSVMATLVKNLKGSRLFAVCLLAYTFICFTLLRLLGGGVDSQSEHMATPYLQLEQKFWQVVLIKQVPDY